MATDNASTRFFAIMLKLRQLSETYTSFTIQEILAVDNEVMAPLLEFAKDVTTFAEELKEPELSEQEILMTWPKFVAVEGFKLRKENPTLTQPQILQMLSPMWKQRNARLGL